MWEGMFTESVACSRDDTVWLRESRVAVRYCKFYPCIQNNRLNAFDAVDRCQSQAGDVERHCGLQSSIT